MVAALAGVEVEMAEEAWAVMAAQMVDTGTRVDKVAIKEGGRRGVAAVAVGLEAVAGGGGDGCGGCKGGGTVGGGGREAGNKAAAVKENGDGGEGGRCRKRGRWGRRRWRRRWGR